MYPVQEAGKGLVKSAKKAVQSKEISILNLRCVTQKPVKNSKKTPVLVKLFDEQKCTWRNQNDI